MEAKVTVTNCCLVGKAELNALTLINALSSVPTPPYSLLIFFLFLFVFCLKIFFSNEDKSFAGASTWLRVNCFHGLVLNPFCFFKVFAWIFDIYLQICCVYSLFCIFFFFIFLGKEMMGCC